MWFESQNCAMMGLQATTGKRKLEAATAPGESSPAKNGRWEAEDCIARLQAVAVPSDAWKAATLLSDDFEDDEDFDDDLSDDDRCHGVPETARFVTAAPLTPLQPPQPQQQHHHHHQHHQPTTTTTTSYASNGVSVRYQSTADYWQYYQPPQQQTIRCEENGKSYLELGAAPPVRTRCCDGRTRWCHVPCYRQRRLAVLNLSMCKLARYRQCSDPSLRRSVLICNTLRRLEREMEAEPPEPTTTTTAAAAATNNNNNNNAAFATSLPELSPPSRVNPVPEPTSSLSLSLSNSSTSSSISSTAAAANATSVASSIYENSLREMTSSSGRATPFPQTAPTNDADSGIGDDETTRPINWGSVLSLTSQTDLESLNNNELYAELGLSDFEWSSSGGGKDSATVSTRAENEWDGFMHVLVGGS